MNGLKTFVLLTGMTLLFVLIGSLLGGTNGMVMAFCFALVMNMVSYWFSDKIVLKMYRAQPASESEYPGLYKAVRLMVKRAGIPMPRVYIIPDHSPNAFATGRNPDHAVVACTTGLLGLLNENEIAGVLGHELGHVKNRDILIGTIAASVAGAIMMLAKMAQWGAMFGGGRSDDNRNNPLGLVGVLLVAVLAPLAAVLIQTAISRSREYGADEAGATLSGNPRALASALRKIHAGVKATPLVHAGPATAHMFIANPLSGKSLMNLFSTHPPMEERVARLERMPGR